MSSSLLPSLFVSLLRASAPFLSMPPRCLLWPALLDDGRRDGGDFIKDDEDDEDDDCEWRMLPLLAGGCLRGGLAECLRMVVASKEAAPHYGLINQHCGATVGML